MTSFFSILPLNIRRATGKVKRKMIPTERWKNIKWNWRSKTIEIRKSLQRLTKYKTENVTLIQPSMLLLHVAGFKNDNIQELMRNSLKY